MLAVADGVQDADEDVIHHRKDGTAEVVTEIDDRLGHNLGGSSHPAQYGWSKCNACDGQRDTGAKTEGDGGMYGLAQGVVLLCTEGAGDDHAGSHSNSVEEADHQKYQTAGGAYGRQGVVADVIAYAPSVESIV